MADQDLRKRLATAAFLAISNETIDLIHERLMASEEAAKIPLTIKFDFSTDEDGILACDIIARCNILLQSHRVSLTTDGKQLRLFRETPAPREEEVEPEPETTEEDEPRVEETRAAVPPPAPRATKKAARKKKAAKKAPRRKAAAAAKPAAVPPITPAKPREEPREAQSATERLAQIARNNESLYRDGIIDSTQAKMAGVDVEAVDASKGGGSALTEADLVALGEGSY